ncbi:hypothetical protein C3L33_03446, partial [Rhododendron williamsianum]
MFSVEPFSVSFVHGISPFFLVCLKYFKGHTESKFLNSLHHPVGCNRVKDCCVNTFRSFSSPFENSTVHPSGLENREELSREGCNDHLCELCGWGDADNALLLLARMEAVGFRPNATAYICLITALGNVGRTLEADAILQECYQVIRLYRDNGMWKKAMSIVREIKEMGVSLDKKIYNSIIDTFGKYGDLGEALEVFEKMQEEGIKPDIMTWNLLIKWHCNSGYIDHALELFAKMQEQGLYPDPKIFICSLVVWGSRYGRFEDAEECVNALKVEGIQLSASIFCVLANAYAQQGLCEQTVKVLQLMEAEGIEPNLIMLNVLINAFGVSGGIWRPYLFIIGISPDVVTYGTLMKAFIRAKNLTRWVAVQVPVIFKEMESAGCTPDRKAREMLQNALMVLEQRHI